MIGEEMASDVAVVIPCYRNELTITERIALDRCMKILGEYPVYLVIPRTLCIDRENLPSRIEIVFVPDEWMRGVEAYNKMMLSVKFYDMFERYQYILLYQLDAYVFSDRLMEFCSLGYDYIGAPWIEGKFDVEHEENGIVYVGNGGFSLRKVSSCISVLRENEGKIVDYNEDVFWGAQNSATFKVAPVDIAVDFAFERPVRLLYEKNRNKLPFGCHAWMRYDFAFWKPYFLNDGYNELQEYMPEKEYDLHNQYFDQRFMMADEAEILSAIRLLTDSALSKIYIYGAGQNGKLCGYLLRKIGGMEVEFLDKDQTKWGEIIYGFSILSPKNASADEKTVIIVTVNKPFEVIGELVDRGFEEGKNLLKLDSLIHTINSMISQ